MKARSAVTLALVLTAVLVSTFSGFAQVSNPAGTQPSMPAPGAAGPTPYPREAKDWPGQGAIRVFGYMADNREAFWAERDRKQGSVVFAGDSLIGGWGTMSKDFAGLLVANRGIGGEPTRGLLFRFKEDVLDLQPKAIVLLTGSNDLSAQQDIRQTRSNISDMLDLAERASPGVPIVLCTLPPRQNARSPIDPQRLLELNRHIAALAHGRERVAVLDLHALLADGDGSPHAEYFAADKLHLSAAGYQRFRAALLPLLKQFNIG
jgi:lysophospholipase L1-like esterase